MDSSLCLQQYHSVSLDSFDLTKSHYPVLNIGLVLFFQSHADEERERLPFYFHCHFLTVMFSFSQNFFVPSEAPNFFTSGLTPYLPKGTNCPNLPRTVEFRDKKLSVIKLQVCYPIPDSYYYFSVTLL